MTDTTRRGDCYEAAVNIILELKLEGTADNATLVHGLVTGTGGEALGFRYGHAWVEIGDVAFDYSNGRKITLRREAYYALGKIAEEDTTRYSFEEARSAMLEHETYGPWEDRFFNEEEV